ncbi:hypothetical protein Bca52824_088240 [Brassica carinata]|uniref:Replication protein A 70 kDa DNA-binding subunit B/D first OB fold domain-containing protein n=1 Tax=Brassica carinata TaxID=52824 RepID=A0A8X7TNN1_BRACI|nr:hypothetical protein Bca52824_088240 [Brassica carinata]
MFQHGEVRLLRFWEAKKSTKGTADGVEMLLVDEHSTLIQGSVPETIQLTFRGRLTEGSVYTLSGFNVTRSNPKFRLSDGPVSIRFNEGTAFKNVMGELRAIRSTITDRLPGAQRLMLTLRLEGYARFSDICFL